ncbi:MAG: ABC transporter permease, partial [Cyclobacteriaceae bacterium]|nr:ABC transporter permease [Cyclobacteriaceae bacterium]
MTYPKPPSWALTFFRWFCHPGLANSIEGDLMELYHERLAMGKRKADLYFVLDVIMLFRPGIIRPSDPYPSNSNAMFKSYFTIAGRNLLRNKGYSAINIGGLAAGMTISMLIVLWMWDELTFDSYHENRSRIVRVMQHQTVDGKVASQFAVPMPLEAAIRNTFSDDFTHISLVSWVGGHILSTEEKNISQLGTFVQASFPEIISLRMVSGPKDAMHDPSAIILSASAATALFGAKDPINQTVRIDDTMDFKVTGVYEDLPVSSSFHDAAFLASWDVYTASYDWLKRSAHQWDNNSFQLFALLAPGADVDVVSEKIKMVRADNAGPERFKPEVFLHPMSDWHLRSEWKNGVKTGGSIQMVWLFGTIGVFVLLLACINFMNLSTARSEKRAKEVGIRMSIGSRRSQLINQFLTESFFVVSIAFLISILLVLLSLPWFNLLAGKQISIPWSNPVVWAACLAFVMITSLVAGSYPALFLSSFRPVKVLKGTFKAGRLSSVPRKTLVVLQFTVSVALVIGTILVYQQIEFTKNRPVGFEPEGLIMIQMRSPEFYGKYDVLREAFNKSGGVDEMSMSSSPLTGIWQNSGGFRWQGKDPNSQSADFGTIWITPEYGKTVNWSIKKG